MTSSRRLSVITTFLILMITTTSFRLMNGGIDTKFRSQNLNIVIQGTSTLHDWEMKSDNGKLELLFALDNNDKITNLTGLNISIPAENLKSEHTMMDNNAYKALKTGANKNITFVLSSGSVSQSDATTYQIKAIGKLTIAGNTRETDVVATAKYNVAEKSFTISGSKKLKMTDYGVTPPTVMFGSIKTGNDITVNFNTKIIR